MMPLQNNSPPAEASTKW